MTLDELNRLGEADAYLAFEKCCGASRWVSAMVATRPFASMEQLLAVSDETWEDCKLKDVLEAFEHHPRIGDVESLAKNYANTKAWASGEQSGVEGADRAILEQLAKANAEYEEKFEHIFIVCAAGKSAAEMLDLLEDRLHNEPGDEMLIAAEEQNKITHLRLKKLLS